jgi:acetyl/propionyl-CoA carboxylase alpha subunit
VDSGVYEGSEISIHYDPMVAKLIVWAADREKALNRLERALAELRVEGIRTTAPLFRALLADPDFRSGNLDIGMLDRKLAAGELNPPTDSALDDLPLIAAALAHSERANQTAAGPADGTPARRSRWAGTARYEARRNASWT